MKEIIVAVIGVVLIAGIIAGCTMDHKRQDTEQLKAAIAAGYHRDYYGRWIKP